MQVARVLAEYRQVRIEADHPFFHSFFDMETIYFPHRLVDVMPSYYALFEGNDPAQRMMAMIKYNNDITEFWDWSDQGWLPIDITNEAYELGVSYMIYALTH